MPRAWPGSPDVMSPDSIVSPFQSGAETPHVLQTSLAAEDVSDQLSLSIGGATGFSLDYKDPPHLLVAQFMMDSTVVNYTAYQAICAPDYCDFAQSKTVFNWVSEFLSTVGGLWTIGEPNPLPGSLDCLDIGNKSKDAVPLLGKLERACHSLLGTCVNEAQEIYFALWPARAVWMKTPCSQLS